MVDLFFYAIKRRRRKLPLKGLRSLRSLRPLPPYPASSLRENLSPAGPSPCPCPGVDTPFRGNFRLRRYIQTNNCTNFDVMNKIYAYLYYQSHKMYNLI